MSEFTSASPVACTAFPKHSFTVWVTYLLIFCGSVPVVFGQQIDTTRVYELSTIVATADRYERELSGSAAAISAIDSTTMVLSPVRSLPDVLNLVPGVFMFDLDGLGFKSQATIRGFYGGGETEYLRVFIDDYPVNLAENGTVDWNAISLASIQSIEVLRGGASAMYGDAALGGIVRIQSRRTNDSGVFARIGSGSFGSRFFSLNPRIEGLHAGISYESSDGFRENLNSNAESPAYRNLGAFFSYNLIEKAYRRYRVHGSFSDTRNADPGPLRSADVELGTTSFNPAFELDSVTRTTFRAGFQTSAELSDSWTFTSNSGIERLEETGIRTLQLSADFADSQSHPVQSLSGSSSIQFLRRGLHIPFAAIFTAGIDGQAGLLTSTWESLDGAPSKFKISGDASRISVSPFFQYEFFPLNELSVVLGMRMDHLRDHFTPMPDDEAIVATFSRRHTAFNPKAGINFQFVKSETHRSNLFLTTGKSFKAPTLAQRFDQRPLPVPFPPYMVSLSNPDLKPQTGWNIEGGIYHSSKVVPDRIVVELSATVYQMQMKDELDFSFETFRYENIVATRHRGLETGLRLYFGRNASVFLQNTMQQTTFSDGPNLGNYVKAIPRHVNKAGIQFSFSSLLNGSLQYVAASRIFLDDENTLPLDDYSRIDAQVNGHFERITLSCGIFNLLDRRYSTTGYADPGGGDTVFLYPAAPRHIRLSASINL